MHLNEAYAYRECACADLRVGSEEGRCFWCGNEAGPLRVRRVGRVVGLAGLVGSLIYRRCRLTYEVFERREVLFYVARAV
jgi:hypothetical protein